ncbi:DNA integrity scanning protein DisA, partial [Streptomyces daliensis]|nr:DNA integrity scanning protein DisA [Streptomyces daliensis]MBR7679197.1 DNA integrity scanning protein DisA [Streptomyces daliensis]
MAANDRAAAPGRAGGSSGASSGADGLMRATLSAVAPGTALRDGLERVLRGNTG